MVLQYIGSRPPKSAKVPAAETASPAPKPASTLLSARCTVPLAKIRAAYERLAARFPLTVVPVRFALRDANDALQALRNGDIDGAAVLVP